MNADDVEIMLRLCAHGPEPAREAERARWRRLWRSARIEGVVMENLSPRDGDEAVGLVCATLVPPAVTNRLLGQSSSMADALVAATEGRKSPWPDDKAVGQANAGVGLDLLIMWTGYANGHRTALEAAELRSRVLTAFADRCAGHRVHRYMIESGDPAVVERFSAYGAEILRQRGPVAVSSVDREHALAEQNIWMLRFFAYEPPILGFSPAQRTILLLARQGYTDGEIAAEIGKTQDSVKKRWASIYTRFGEVFPGRLPSAGASARGAEKRRTLLTFLKDRPEELRPYNGS